MVCCSHAPSAARAASRKARPFGFARSRPIGTINRQLNVSEGPFDGSESDNSESDRVVLVGFVEWKLEPGSPKGRIAKFHPRDKSSGVGPRYAGVAADEVVGRGGELTLWSDSPRTQDAAVVVVGDHDTGKDENAFAIGLDDGKGNINNILTVDPKGNVRLKGGLYAGGAVKGQIRSGEVAIESGVASDGVTLPLPAGIDPERVAKGEIIVHATVTPRIDPKADDRLDSSYLPAVVECAMDENRFVRCSIHWFKLPVKNDADNSTVFFETIEIAGAVNYTIMASVAASDGGEN